MTAPVPPDFPTPAPSGAVPGAQPKLLARAQGEQFVASQDELRARFALCEDLAMQLTAYAARKAAAHTEWSESELLGKVAAAVRQKSFGWGLSPAEAEWVVKRVQALRSKASGSGL